MERCGFVDVWPAQALWFAQASRLATIEAGLVEKLALFGGMANTLPAFRGSFHNMLGPALRGGASRELGAFNRVAGSRRVPSNS